MCRRVVFVTAVCLALLGCEGDYLAAEPVETCVEVAVQCRLPAGPLGVCERRTCDAGEQTPCFVCTPQH